MTKTKRNNDMISAQDKTLIEELNLQHLPEAKQAAQLAEFYEALDMKLGMALEDKLTDRQLLEFEKVSDAGDDVATGAWLRKAIPDYEQVVAEETAALKLEIQEAAAQYQQVIDDIGKGQSA